MGERSVRALGAVAVLVPFLVGLTAAGVDPEGRAAFRFQDAEIVESSGLVVEGDLAHTVNDSGDIGRVFTVDTTTGETVGVTFWADGPRDVEALAPGGPGHVWVADIGDNGGSRDSVSVTRVPVGQGDRTVDEETIDLVYPDGARDAESLLVHPVTGRIYIATKGVFGGELHAAPPDLADDAPNVLGLVGPVAGIVTDGAFFNDGEHLIVRSYSDAVVYTFPDLEPVGSFNLPSQVQGEGIAVPSGPLVDFVYLSSEGQRAPVLRVPIPPRIVEQLASAPNPTPTPTEPVSAPVSPVPEPSGGATSVEEITPQALDRDAWPRVVSALIFLGVLGVLVRALRPS